MLINKSIKELSESIKKREISPADLIRETYSQIEKLDGKLHSFINIREKNEAIKEAEEKSKSSGGQTSVLHGLPFSVKDAYVTRDLPTTAASKVLDGYMSPFNATVVEKLLGAGGILVGKNNLDSWGHGASNENSDYNSVPNPWDMERIAGGSSGGSAAAIASRITPYAIGEDTGGSIRNPASFCNVSGLKVTYGRVSRYGAIAYASSLDTVGPMAKSVEDLAYILEIIAGRDPYDATSSSKPAEKYSQYLGKEIKGKVIGLPKEFFDKGLDLEIKKTVLAASKVLEKLGAKIIEVSLPHFVYGISIYYLVALSETSSNLSRYDGIRYGHERELFSAETTRRILLGTYALSAGYADELYKKAQKLRTVLINEYEQALSKCDVLLGPVTPSLPSKIGQMISDPLKNLLEDLYTGTVNLVGAPSLAIPAGFTESGLPIGMQIVGKKFGEGELFQIGHLYQQETDWHKKLPPLIK
jgi:aspartyl-tRNA(Asn)/glutamyl-tRNA(Gln) amidotransferase subunit A